MQRKKKLLGKATVKTQSAMEYLMTYGWAILIIAVVLAALFELGIFNPMTFAPKASPGSCQVVRPEGAGTINFMSLEGECNGELPQYVADFNSTTYIVAPAPYGGGSSPITFTIWVKEPSVNFGDFVENYRPGSQVLILRDQGNGDDAFTLCSNNGNGCAYTLLFTAPHYNNWNFIVGDYNGITLTAYVNGGFRGSYGVSNIPIDTYNSIGMGSQGFVGSIANVQIYNTSLSQPEIQALYQEGIGGAPIDLQNLVGWWPLNGNANDYSGNGNNGVPSNVVFTNNWYSGYSTP